MKIPKQISLKYFLVGIFATILLLSCLFYVFAQTPSETFWISGGTYPGAPSYTVWREGSNYFAKSSFGQIEFSGTNPATVIQAALDTGLGEVFLKNGIYAITAGGTSGLTIRNSGASLRGENMYNTILRFSGGCQRLINIFTGTDDVEISHLRLENTNSSSLYGIMHSTGAGVDHISIHHVSTDMNSYAFGVYIVNSRDVMVHDCVFYEVAMGVDLQGCNNSVVHSNSVVEAEQVGILINGGVGVSVTGNVVREWGLGANYVGGIQVNNVVDARNIAVTGNTLYGGVSSYNYSGIVVSAELSASEVIERVSVVGNTIMGQPDLDFVRVGIYLHSHATHNLRNLAISGNVIELFQTGIISMANYTTISCNVVYNVSRGIWVERTYVRGTIITGNTLYGNDNSTSLEGILLNTQFAHVTGNSIVHFGLGVDEYEAGYGAGDYNVITENRIYYCGTNFNVTGACSNQTRNWGSCGELP